MSELERKVLGAIGIGVLHVLASPLRIPEGLRWLRARSALWTAMHDGGRRCPHCENWIVLLGQTECRRCLWVEWGFTLACSRCRQLLHDARCPRCLNSVKVW